MWWIVHTRIWQHTVEIWTGKLRATSVWIQRCDLSDSLKVKIPVEFWWSILALQYVRIYHLPSLIHPLTVNKALLEWLYNYSTAYHALGNIAYLLCCLRHSYQYGNRLVISFLVHGIFTDYHTVICWWYIPTAYELQLPLKEWGGVYFNFSLKIDPCTSITYSYSSYSHYGHGNQVRLQCVHHWAGRNWLA